MNVFQFLGLPANHRKDTHIVHRVKNLHEVPESKLKWPAIAQKKEDGVFAIVVTNNEGEVGIFSRTGKRFVGCEFLANNIKFHQYHDPSMVYLCELVCSEVSEISLEQLSGIVNPNRTEPVESSLKTLFTLSANLVCFDVIRRGDFMVGYTTSHYHTRFSNNLLPVDRVATRLVYNLDEFLDYCEQLTEAGYEGAVLKQLEAPWIAGKKDYCYTKQVRGVDFDLEVLAIEWGSDGTKRHGQVTNLVVRWRLFGHPDGEVVTLPVDGRFTDEDRIAWYNNPSLIIGKIVHVHALQLGSKGSLRLAKVRAVRIDKDKPDL